MAITKSKEGKYRAKARRFMQRYARCCPKYKRENGVDAARRKTALGK